MIRYLALAACAAPAAAPVANVSIGTLIHVHSFADAPASLAAADCTYLPGTPWPEAEEAVLRQVQSEHASTTLRVERIANDRFVDDRYKQHDTAPSVALRVTHQRGYVWVHARGSGLPQRVYCIDIQRDGRGFELVPIEVRWEIIE